MNHAIELRRGITAEIYKYRRTFIIWFLILAPAFIPAINTIIFLSKGAKIIQPEDNPWHLLFQFSAGPGNFLFPFFVMILALFVNSLEHSSNTWKLIYSQPLSRFSLYFSKVIVFTLMILFSLLLFSVLTIAAGQLVHIIQPSLGFDQPFEKSILIGISLKTFLCTLGYASIQFWISQRWKNLMIPLGFGIAGFISFMILAQGWKYVEYHVYGYPTLSVGSISDPEFAVWNHINYVWRSIGVAFMIYTLAAIDNQRKRII